MAPLSHGNDRTYTEYDLMKYKLTNDALGIALWDMDVKVEDPTSTENPVTWSQELRELLGFTDEKDFPNTITALAERFHPEDSEKAFTAFAAHFIDRSGKTPYDIEYRLMHKEGTYRWYRGFGTTLRDAQGIPLRVAGAVMDIDEIKHAQSEKNEAIDTMKTVLDGLEAIIYVTDPVTGEILFTNESMRKQYGIDGSLDGHICYKVLQVGMEEKCTFCPCYQLDQEPDSVIVWETTDAITQRRHRKTDCYIPWPGRKIAHLQHAVDITDLVEAKEAIEERGKMLEILNDTAVMFLSQSVGVFEETMTSGMKLLCDAMTIDRVSVWRNAKILGTLHTSQIYRWDRESGGTTTPTPGLEDVTYQDLAPRWEELLAGGDVVNGPSRLLPEAAMLQSFGVVSAFVVPVFINQAFWGFVLFEDRISERYFSAESIDIMRSAAFLCANTVILNENHERDRLLTEKVKSALLETQDANEAKDIFLSRMSHEMLTPMNAITGMSQIMSIIGVPDKLRDSHKQIETASRQLLDLINDLLDMTGRGHGSFALMKAPFNFYSMVENIVEVISPAINEKRQTLDLHVDLTTPRTLIGDERRLIQVINNLLLNANKFSPEESLIVLSFTNESFPENLEEDGIVYLKVKVKDEGIGISEEQQEEIFKLFEQVDGGLTRKIGGVGLGLPLSEHIVTLMGGRIWLESEPGKGSTFTFSCKLKKG